MKKTTVGIVLALFVCVLAACSSSPEALKGNYIIAKQEQERSILVAKDISWKDAKRKTFADFRKNNVELVFYIVEDSQLFDDLKVGEAVKVTPKANENGEYIVMQSDPPQIVAGKIEREQQ
ncbi:DUF3221 domain-containing protein [Cohnella abietis]|uniref:DUF3221 domain-containing protein n=1 Tax=Cohnella abietis TaxID=2507935 RepID=A0A3T1D200_9BACL|nr:DUF3221 domain-containing protein [Cohnella abietis]BBI32116.1 hypothetical protein KCTCHS21_15150 [Cohnella abietis]